MMQCPMSIPFLRMRAMCLSAFQTPEAVVGLGHYSRSLTVPAGSADESARAVSAAEGPGLHFMRQLGASPDRWIELFKQDAVQVPASTCSFTCWSAALSSEAKLGAADSCSRISR